MTSFADLEISLHGADPEVCGVAMRLVTPNDQGDRRLDGAKPLQLGKALVEELLVLDLQADPYGVALTKALFAHAEMVKFYSEALKTARDLKALLRVSLAIRRTLWELDSLRWEAAGFGGHEPVAGDARRRPLLTLPERT